MAKQERERKYKFNVVRQVYNGIRFRSRLEARWAVYFDIMEIPYIYEPEGICLWRGGVYMPDFWLPRHHGGCYAEVKPNEFTDEELKKCRMLCRMSGNTVILLDGHPEPILYYCYSLVDNVVNHDDILIHSHHTQTESRFIQATGYSDRRSIFGLLSERSINAIRHANGIFTKEDE